MTPQNYYKKRMKSEEKRIDEDLIVELVRRERRLQPRLGGRKLYEILGPALSELGLKIGRDQLFRVLREREMLVPPLPRTPRTTPSRHCLPVFGNLIAALEPTDPNQIWVSDITYVRIETGFVYLALIMDRYSRKIVGHHCGDTLEAIGCVRALDQALAELPPGCRPIHHSDRGCQYCCHEYVERLTDRGLAVSMTERNHCYENAHAERVQGILKQEYGLRMTFKNLEQARNAVEQAVWLYNHRRPHSSLQFQIPAEVHRQVA